jgi:hypothetical protein
VRAVDVVMRWLGDTPELARQRGVESCQGTRSGVLAQGKAENPDGQAMLAGVEKDEGSESFDDWIAGVLAARPVDDALRLGEFAEVAVRRGEADESGALVSRLKAELERLLVVGNGLGFLTRAIMPQRPEKKVPGSRGRLLHDEAVSTVCVITPSPV